jgi:LmbE family N-acetylglucosaminyl deacetylase|tara:strand:+ start:701 stop:1405 length:705 start_codon:yes stop_codon:yes gene_type:complete
MMESFNKFKKFLIVVAHPDDDVLGCGGTIKKLTKLKKKVRVIFIAEGSSCRFKNLKKYFKEINNSIKQREKYAKQALIDLGVRKCGFYNLKCGKLNKYPITEIAKIVEDEITNFKPEVVISHSNFDVNVDHRTVYQACLQSTRPTSKTKIKALISFEILSSTEWKFSKIFEPNLFVNIEKEIKYKIKALKRYKSEIRKYPHPRSAEGIKILGSYRGIQSHNKFAEAFKIIRLFS